jgi:hypothetical protein
VLPRSNRLWRRVEGSFVRCSLKVWAKRKKLGSKSSQRISSRTGVRVCRLTVKTGNKLKCRLSWLTWRAMSLCRFTTWTKVVRLFDKASGWKRLLVNSAGLIRQWIRWLHRIGTTLIFTLLSWPVIMKPGTYQCLQRYLKTSNLIGWTIGLISQTHRPLRLKWSVLLRCHSWLRC